MGEAFGPPLKAAAIMAFATGLALLILNPPSFAGLEDLITLFAAIVAVILITAWVTVALTGNEMPEPEFRKLLDRSERLASMPPPDHEPGEFDELVQQAIDELPEEFQELLHDTPVIVSGRGREHHAYGHYIGDTVARDNFRDHIVIYQDTLERDFGHNHDLLRAQVQRTVRHELAHHLGWGESGVRDLGL